MPGAHEGHRDALLLAVRRPSMDTPSTQLLRKGTTTTRVGAPLPGARYRVKVPLPGVRDPVGALLPGARDRAGAPQPGVRDRVGVPQPGVRDRVGAPQPGARDRVETPLSDVWSRVGVSLPGARPEWVDCSCTSILGLPQRLHRTTVTR